MIGILSALLLFSFIIAAPGYAAVQKGRVVDSKVSLFKFWRLPENHGLDRKLIHKKYEMYLRTLGHAPQFTLTKSRLRSDEIRKRA